MLEMDSKSKAKSTRKFAEDWVPVRAIQNGEIILDNGVRVTGVKVRPRNIFILDYDSQWRSVVFWLCKHHQAEDA